jgi:hypothetical protein
MAMAAAGISYRAITNVFPMDSVETLDLFKDRAAPKVSPIDAFFENTRKINLLYTVKTWTPETWQPEFGTLILLGYMSAVESYFRALIAGLVNLDEATRRRAGPKTLTFGIATGHPDPALLPEVLLEHTSFTAAKHVKTSLNEFLGLKDTEFPNDVRFALEEFDKICEVRHCCVHRFGKLGTKNAWELGFDTHKSMIERPFSPTIHEVRAISASLVMFIRTINNYVFHAMLDRIAFDGQQGKISWSWNWTFEADEARFRPYYEFFASVTPKPESGTLEAVYADFAAHHIAILQAKEARERKKKGPGPKPPLPEGAEDHKPPANT